MKHQAYEMKNGNRRAVAKAVVLFLEVVLSIGSVIDCTLEKSNVQPQGVHIAFAGNASTNMIVSFYTCGAPAAATNIQPMVHITGRSTKGVTSCRGARCFHDVQLDELTPATRYQYYVSFANATSQKFEFSTSPLQAESWTAICVGDMGVNQSGATLAALKSRVGMHNFSLHVGDVSYADDYHLPFHIENSSGRDYDAVYDLFQTNLEPITATAPYMVLPGNHDVTCHVTDDLGCPDALRNFSALRYRYRMPSLESYASTKPHMGMWYSFRVGGVHFVSISTETDFPHAPTTPHTFVGGGAGGGFGDQLGWLRRDLAAARENPLVIWIVAMGHRPWYASKTHDWPPWTPDKVQASFEPLFHEFGVDIYLCGHKHYYERIKPAFGGKAISGGTVQIVNGAAGNNEGLDKGKGVGSMGGLIVAANYVDAGFGEFEQVNATRLEWRYVLSKDGSVFDRLVVHAKGRARRP